MACDSLATDYHVSSLVHLSLSKYPHPGCVSDSKGMEWRMHKPLSYKNPVSQCKYTFSVFTVSHELVPA